MKPIFSTLIAAVSLFVASLPIMGCGGKDTPGHIPDYQPPKNEDYKYAKAEGNVRIMTYNCFYCKSNTSNKTFSDEHTADFAKVIKALNPDVVVIQELDSGTTERAKRYLLDDIRRAHRIDPADKKAAGRVIQLGKEQARQYLRDQQDFVFNATNLTRELRGKWTQLFADYRARIRITYLEVPWQQLLRQNKQREHSVPETVIRRLLGKLEIPFYDEAHEVEYCIGE